MGKHFDVLSSSPGADPRMVRIGTAPPPWQINHANSAYFRLFLSYFRVISVTQPPLLDLGPLFTYPGSTPDLVTCIKIDVYFIDIKKKTNKKQNKTKQNKNKTKQTNKQNKTKQKKKKRKGKTYRKK